MGQRGRERAAILPHDSPKSESAGERSKCTRRHAGCWVTSEPSLLSSVPGLTDEGEESARNQARRSEPGSQAWASLEVGLPLGRMLPFWTQHPPLWPPN